MTVAELIEELRDFDDDMDVMIGYDYGDRQHTMVFERVRNISEERVVRSGYFNKYVIESTEDEVEWEGNVAVLLMGQQRRV